VIEFSRHICNLTDANSKEFNKETPHPVIDIMETQKKVREKGGTMRLGAYPCVIKTGTKAEQIYGQLEISERHRHRFELNNAYREDLQKAGMILSGAYQEEDLVEIIELPDHPWFVGVQFHPELKSRITRAHPLFREFVKAALKRNDQN